MGCCVFFSQAALGKQEETIAELRVAGEKGQAELKGLTEQNATELQARDTRIRSLETEMRSQLKSKEERLVALTETIKQLKSDLLGSCVSYWTCF